MTAVTFKKHSTQIGHKPRCYCPTCADAKRWNERLRSRGHRIRVDDEYVRLHLKALLMASGNSPTVIAEATGLTADTVYGYAHRGYSISAYASKQIMQVTPKHLKLKMFSRAKYDWRVGVLRAQGFPLSKLSEMAGTRLTLTGACHGVKNEKVEASKWWALDKVWHQIGGRMATPDDGISQTVIRRMRTSALRQGFHPLAAYDHEFDREPADTSEMEAVLQEDRDHLDLMIATRIRARMQPRDIIEELTKLNPDFDLETAVDRTRARLRRNPRWGLPPEDDESVTI